MARLGRGAVYEERLCAGQAIEQGKSAELVTEIVGFARSMVFGWWKAFREGGEAALRPRPLRAV
ncbi:MAG: helix-turn-helix domain-containing protein [Candidatus Dormibacteria bacterium]